MRNLFHILFFCLVFVVIPEIHAQEESAAVPYSTYKNPRITQTLITKNDTDDLILWALPTNGATSGNTRAPGNAWKYQRTEYLITAAEMAASGFPSGSVLNSIGFSIYTAGGTTLTGTLNIYLRNTTDVTYTLGTGWTTTGFTQVSTNSSFTVPISPADGVYDIPFTGGSSFTYTGGGVYVAWEFSSEQAAGVTAVVHNCNTALTSGLYGQRSNTALPTTLAASNWRPATRFGTSSYTDVISISNIYTLEKVPVPFGTPTPVDVRVENVSSSAATFEVTITIRNAALAVRYTATETVSDLAGGTSIKVNFPGWTPTILEDVIITATTSEVPDENFTANNTLTQNSNVNANLFSYTSNYTSPGGYGFTHPGGGIFAAKYTMNGAGLVSGANVFLYNYAANIGNTVRAVVLNSSGTIVAQSADLVIQSGDMGTNKQFTFPAPPVVANDYFYVGLVQVPGTAQYYPLGLKTEIPQRGNTFYSFPIDGGTPSMDDVDAKYMIEASVIPVAGPGVATFPNPANNATNINISGLTLSWTNPAGATTNQVYFGTDPEAMSVIHTGSLATSVSAPAPINYFTIYYWRVDETGPGGTTTGPVWIFRTQLDPAGVILPYSQSFATTSWPAFFSQSYSGAITSNRWGISNSNISGGAPYEIFAASIEGIGVSRLILGPINTTGISTLGVSFRQFFDDYAAGVTYKIQTSPDGVTWTNQPFSFTSGNGNVGPEMVHTTINISGNTNYIAWVLDGDHWQFDYWIIDDIQVSQQLANDVGTTSIILGSPLPTGAVTPKATVLNYGSLSNTFNVQMTITGGYTSTKSVTLASGASQEVIFDSWNAPGGTQTVNVCTQLGTDQNTSNDCMSKDVNIIAGWTHTAPLPTTTYLGSGAGYISGGVPYIFSIGGNTTSAAATECYKYNVNTNSWSSIAPLPDGRRVLATAVVGDYLYAIAGSDTHSTYQSTVFRYSITGNIWTTVASLPAAIAWGKAVGYNNRIYFAGGHNGTVPLPTVYVYDVAGNTWASADSMPGSRFGGAFSIVGSKLVYVGGSGYTGITNGVYVGTISSGNPLSISWVTASNKFPGLDKETPYTEINDLNAEIKKNTKSDYLSSKSASYPGGVMYRFDGAPWGTDGMIVAGGSPTADWVPASPNPCYVYKPDTDTWTQQGEVPTAVLGSSLGTVNNGNTWKLVVVSGLGLDDVTNVTQIFTATLGTIPTTFPLTVNIMDGWSMVSVPGTHPTNSTLTLGGQAEIRWQVYTNGLAHMLQLQLHPQEKVTGCFIQALKHITQVANGLLAEYQIVAHDPIPVTTGWNMIGGYDGTRS